MKVSEVTERGSTIGRRSFVKMSAVAAAVAMLDSERASAQGAPWWAVRPGKAGPGKPVAIDVHSHWSPEPYNKASAEMGHPVETASPMDFDLDKRRKWMDDHGVQLQVLTINGRMPWQWASAEEGARLAQILNDAAIEAHTAFPDRFVGAVEMSVRDLGLALKELNRVAGKPGMRAVRLPDTIDKRDYLFDPAMAPIFARIEELGYPILFHQMGLLENGFGNRQATIGLDEAFLHAVEATKFITSGTLDKYSKLEIVLPHAGGAFPYVAGRVDHFLYHMQNPGQVKLARPFKDYLRRFHYDYLTYYPEAFRFLLSIVGSDRIVVGTDGYGAKDVEYPSAVIDQFNLPAADRERILRGNAAKLLHL